MLGLKIMDAHVKRQADAVAIEWKDAPYYADAEKWLDVFWGQNSVFKPLFQRLNHDRIIDLACGHGRHSWQMREWPNTKILVDIVPGNIEACRARFAGYDRVEFLINSGCDLNPIADASVTSVFSYDAMVHFDHMVVGAYLRDIARALAPGGMALLHHSNYGGNPGGHHHQNPHWRNFMPTGLFINYAAKAGLTIVEHRPIDWVDAPLNDAITLLLKPTL